jgi:starch phosphorylase
MTDNPGPIQPLPERLAGLATLASNLYWSWNRDARMLFRAIDGPLWHDTRHNPIALLQRVEPRRLETCARNPDFMQLFDSVMEEFAASTESTGGWFAEQYPSLTGKPIAYFCAEFALHNSVAIYSGGLGVLAGDHCKAASDLGLPFVGIGLLYTRGYFDQRIRLDGWQEDVPEQFDPSVTPLTQVLNADGQPQLASLQISGRTVHVGAWKMQVGRVPLYLLDTDVDGNDPEDRPLSHNLYAGGPELRLRQEAILGIGGVRVLRALGVDPGAWHANEGHAAFMLLERLRELVQAGTALPEAIHVVRSRSLFTTHTPVPAGHDIFSGELFHQVMGEYLESFGVDQATLDQLGHHPGLDHQRFHMTAVAIRLSGRVVGVSRVHGGVSRQMWEMLWPGRAEAKVPIKYVTNGVHLNTWMSHRIKELLDRHLGPDWEAAEDPESLDAILTVDDKELWEVHAVLKASLMDFIRDEARIRWRDRWQDAAHLVGAGTLLHGGAMTIGFARRFAGYKRAGLLFRDPERLRRLLLNPQRPVQLIFAGKAHPADEVGKGMLQLVSASTRDRRFEGRIAFLEDYELHMAHRLVQGVDLWLNTPRIPYEASGTSGMKAALNGVPQLSTDDGWWAEGQTGLNGWTITAVPDSEDQDAAAAEQLYTLLEEQVVPLFYERGDRGIPRQWIARMKQAMWTSTRHFTARRMLEQYVGDYYAPALEKGWPTDDPPTG